MTTPKDGVAEGHAPDLRGAAHELESAIRFAEHGLVPTADEVAEWKLALGELRRAAGVDLPVPPSCAWQEDDPNGNMAGTYTSACGELWSFTEGGVAENNVRFCHGCGKPVNVIPFPRPPEEAAEDGVAVDRHQTFSQEPPTGGP